jgi:hypothetical protein
MLPVFSRQFAGLTVQASHVTHNLSLELLTAAGALVEQETPDGPIGYTRLGRTRRAAIRLALRMGAELILSIDLDRALHWAEYYPQELAATVTGMTEHDFTVIGRTPRAFDSHPRIQRDTEALINHVFSLVSRHAWDVTAATRGLTRRAAEAILTGCLDEGISTDVSWPLFLHKAGEFSIGYLATEGMEFETADRYGEEIAAVGGHAQWIARLDADPRRWAHRVELARIEIEAMLPYSERISP